MDLTALVVSYGLAALLVRAFYPRQGFSSHFVEAAAVFVYVWLGLAMGGPLVLLLDGRAKPDHSDYASPPKYTWAETAWLLIGGYWIALSLFVVPSRLPVNPLLGLFPVLGALVIRLFARKSGGETDPRPGWTNLMAVIVLVTWPVAWIGMILLGKTFS